MASQQHGSSTRKSAGMLGGMISSITSRAQSQLQNLSVSEIPHTLRQAGVTYDPRQSPYTLRLQLMNKALKGVILDSEALGRERQAFSKQIYLWSQDQHKPAEDLADITDRLAFLTFKSGDLEMDYAKELERARNDLKDIRNFENEMTKTRDRRKALDASLAKLQAEPKPRPDHSDRLAALQNEIAQVERESETFESSLDIFKRRKLRSSFETQFTAMRELGEKMALLAGYGELLLEEWDKEGNPPKDGYEGNARSAWVRGAAADALSSYKAPLVPPPTYLSSSAHADLSRHDTRSFGETHRHELANMPAPGDTNSPRTHSTGFPPVSTSTSTHSVPPPMPSRPVPGSTSGHFSSPPLAPHGLPSSGSPLPNSALNHSPADPSGFSPPPLHATGPGPLGLDVDAPSGALGSGAVDIPHPPAGAEPTVAEIGGGRVPTGTGGPATGYFPIRRPSGTATSSSPPTTTSAFQRRPLTKAEEARLDSQSQVDDGQAMSSGPSGSSAERNRQDRRDPLAELGRMASTSRRPGGGADDEPLPAYTLEDATTPDASPREPQLPRRPT